jgi:hypothetical protein
MSPLPVLRPAALLLFASLAAAQITPGTLVVVRAGDGAFALTSSSQHVFLDSYDRMAPAQPAPLQSLAMPITIAGTASQGFLTQSVDGNYLVVTGYGANPYTGLITFTTSVAFPRVIARVALSGAIDATTALSDAYSGGGGLPGDFLSAATVDGSAFWMSGNGIASWNRGVCYTTLGATTSVQLTTTPSFARIADVTNGQLHVSSWSTPFVGVDTVGTGLPTAPGQTTTLLSGLPGSDASALPWDFWFADPSTLWVADSRTNGSGGIQKWTRIGNTWALQYTLAPAPNVGCRSVTGIRDLSGTTLYATTTQIAANQLVSVTDTGAGSPFTTLATAANNTGFRGVRFVRQPWVVTFAGTGCPTASGVPSIDVVGAPISGNANFGIAIGNTPAFSPWFTVVSIGATLGSGIPLSLVGGPPCAWLYTPSLDILLSGVTNGAGTGTTPLSLGIADSALWGLDLPVQHLVLDPVTYGAYGLPLAPSRGMQLRLGN